MVVGVGTAPRRAVLKRFTSSGASVAELCRAKSISVATLHRWQSEAHSDDTPRVAAPSGFLDLGALAASAR